MRLIGYTEITNELLYQCNICKKVNSLQGDKDNIIQSINVEMCILHEGIDLKCNYCNNIHTSDVPLFHDDEEMERVQCPKCHSNQIQLMKRGWKITTGLIGSAKNERVCMKCLHKF